jgi:pectin methylesterase-like acyl-CoA thioesterase/lysophospholipase L1-like esterase
MTKEKIAHWIVCCLFASLYVCHVWAADATVSLNGDGQFKSIHDAIMAAPPNLPSAERPWVIAVKPGVYKELIYVQQERRYIRLVGEEAKTTIITMNLHANLPGADGKPIGTFRTPTVQIDGDGFSAENITFENSAGPVGQALALRVDADKVSFKNCRFLGWQDTILANRGRHYFENCYIAGHVDFIFGAATVWFERCQIHCLRDGYITAASTPAEHPFGFVFSNCKITGEPNVKTYLGRPWRGFASTAFLHTEMSEVVRAEGWHNWTGPEREKTARYSEYNSTGAGANHVARVLWAKKLTEAEANALTLEKVLGGWNPQAPIYAASIFMIGDSTMADKPLADNPERGWGQLLPTFFGAQIAIKNHAMNGRSTKSFIDEGRWDPVLQQLRQGDWVFIQFGHNDEKKEDPKRYAAPNTDYKTNLTRFVNEARSKGVTPILLTPVMRRRFDANGKFFDTHGEYPDAVRALAKELNVTLIDMHQSSQHVIEQHGVEGSKKLFLHIAPGTYKSLPKGKQDDTHFSEYGATQMAGLVVAELRRQKLGLVPFLK